MADRMWEGWILALDTGSPVISVAVGRDGVAAAGRSSEQARASGRLMAMIDEVLREAGIQRTALAGVVAARGPGSFTGLRIGLATALGLSQALELPAVALPTLPLLAALGPAGPGRGRVFGAVRALRGNWFLAERGGHEPFHLHQSDLESLAPATLVGFGLPDPPPGIGTIEPGPLAHVLLRALDQSRPAPDRGALLEPLYLGSAVVSIGEERDAAQLVDLEAASFAAPWRERELHDTVSQPTVLTLVARESGTPAAYALFQRVSADEAELLRVAVAPAARRRGLGRRLLDEALSRLAARGAKTCFLEVAANNAPALALYARLGFTPSGRRRAYYEDGGDAVLMRRTAR